MSSSAQSSQRASPVAWNSSSQRPTRGTRSPRRSASIAASPSRERRKSRRSAGRQRLACARLGRANGRLAPLAAARAVDEHARRARERRDHQAVPRRDDFVVEMRPRPLARASRTACLARASTPITSSTGRPDRAATSSIDCATYRMFWPVNSPCGSASALPRVLDAKAPPDDRRVGAEQRVDLRGRPDVERAFALLVRVAASACGDLGVGVLGREERAVRRRQIAHDVVERVLGDRRVERIAAHLRGLEVREDELRLVVEHLLEVRHAPLGVDRVAMEPAADVIAHAADRHRAQRLERHRFARVVAGERVGVRAGTAARTAVETSARRRTRRGARSNACANAAMPASMASRPATGARSGAASSAPVASRSRSTIVVGRLRADAAARRATRARAPPARRRIPAGPTATLGGKYVPPKNGLQIRRQPHAHRPAARAGRRLHERHVHAIDVRPLLAIDLDRRRNRD